MLQQYFYLFSIVFFKKSYVQGYLKKNNVCIKYNPGTKKQFIKRNSIEHINGKY